MTGAVELRLPRRMPELGWIADRSLFVRGHVYVDIVAARILDDLGSFLGDYGRSPRPCFASQRWSVKAGESNGVGKEFDENFCDYPPSSTST
jgi:hypothetical protein